MVLSIKEFKEFLAHPELQTSTTFPWGKVRDELLTLKNPFTIADVMAMCPNQPRNYVNQHVNQWYEKGLLAKVKKEGRAYYAPKALVS